MAIALTKTIQAPADELDTQINAYIASLVPGDDADPEDPVYEVTGVSVVAPAGGLPFALLSLSVQAAEESQPDDPQNEDPQNEDPQNEDPQAGDPPADNNNGGSGD